MLLPPQLGKLGREQHWKQPRFWKCVFFGTPCIIYYDILHMRRTSKSGTSIIVTNTLYCWGQHSRHHSFFQLLYNLNSFGSIFLHIFLFLKEKKIPNTPAADTVGRPHWTKAKRNCNSVGIIAIGENTNRFNKVMIWGDTHMGRETWTKDFLTQGQFYCQSWKKDLVTNFDPNKLWHLCLPWN